MENGKLASAEADRALKRDALAFQDKMWNDELANAEAYRQYFFAATVVCTGSFVASAWIVTRRNFSFGIPEIVASFRRFSDILQKRSLLRLLFSPFRRTSISNKGEGKDTGKGETHTRRARAASRHRADRL